MVEPLRGGLVRQSTFTKETGIQAIQRPTTTEESKARLVTSSYNRKSVDSSSWSRGQVSLVGGRIVRRASGEQKMLISPGSIRKHSGVVAGDFEQDIATTTASDYLKVTSEKPKLVRRRTWTKMDEDNAQPKGGEYETRKQSDHSKTENQFMAKSRGYDSVVSSGGRVVVSKQKDNLYLEGEQIQKVPEKWEPGQRAAIIKQKDNLAVKEAGVKEASILLKSYEEQKEFKKDSALRQDYQFEIPEVKAWAPGERNAVMKRNDNMVMSGQLKTSVAAERIELDKQIDNVTTRTEKTEARKLDSKKMQNGQFETSRKEWADRAEGEFASMRVESSKSETNIVTKHDHLKENNVHQKESFSTRQQDQWQSADEIKVMRKYDNLKLGRF